MRRQHWSLGCLVMLGLGLLAQDAFGQLAARAAGARTSRASNPSSRIGGTNTASGAQVLGATRRDVALLGQDQFEFTRANRTNRAGRYTSVLPVGMVGLNNTLAAPGGSPLSAQLNRTGEAFALSGIGVATNLALPLPGNATGGLPAANAFIFTPQPRRTEHEEYFDLRPVSDEPAPQATPQTFSGRLEERTAFRVATAASEGIASFKAGTAEPRDTASGRHLSCPTCENELVRAMQKLLLVRDLDESSWLAPLLLTHLALDRERPTLASVYIVETFTRNPEFIHENRESLDAYFGDVGADGRSPILNAQLRRFLRIGELNPDNVEAATIEMYCAWRLNDTSRVRDAFDRFSRIVAKAPTLRPEVAKFMETVHDAAQ